MLRKDGAPPAAGPLFARVWLSAFDEALGQAKLGAEKTFAAGHLAGVGFVIVAGEVEQAVQDEDLDFGGERVALFRCLAARGGDADGQVAGNFFLFLDEGVGGKGEDVGRLVFATEAAVEAADGLVGGEQDGDLAAQTDGGLGICEKAGEGAWGWDGCWRRFGTYGRRGTLSSRSGLRGGELVQIWVEKDHRARSRKGRGSGSPSILRDG